MGTDTLCLIEKAIKASRLGVALRWSLIQVFTTTSNALDSVIIRWQVWIMRMCLT